MGSRGRSMSAAWRIEWSTLTAEFFVEPIERSHRGEST
jgi:hypothetical protein